MNKQERRILSELVKEIIRSNSENWLELKYETQYGPESSYFPYYHSAVQYIDEAERLVGNLLPNGKSELVRIWNSYPHPYLNLETSEQIIKRYARVIVEEIVQRAKSAGARTNF